ncbi:MAG: hypothetical protein HY898_22895 [Deltaproteobacteria bacterium]|nr:hypothetical protein [Deltaproteobacteria bacterium]
MSKPAKLKAVSMFSAVEPDLTPAQKHQADRERNRREAATFCVPERYIGNHFYDFDIDPKRRGRVAGGSKVIDSVWEDMTEAINDERSLRFLFQGPSGVGKTSLASACYLAACSELPFGWLFDDAGNQPQWVDTLEFCNALDKGSVSKAKTATVLCLDDLGRELLMGAAAVTAMVLIIRHRHAHDMPTIVTTWLRDDQIANQYGADVLRRLQDGASVVRWPFNGGQKP